MTTYFFPSSALLVRLLFFLYMFPSQPHSVDTTNCHSKNPVQWPMQSQTKNTSLSSSFHCYYFDTDLSSSVGMVRKKRWSKDIPLSVVCVPMVPLVLPLPIQAMAHGRDFNFMPMKGCISTSSRLKWVFMIMRRAASLFPFSLLRRRSDAMSSG